MKKIIFASLALMLCLFTSCVKDDLYEGPSKISNLSYQPSAVTPKDAVTVSATVTDLHEITEVNILYSVNSGAARTVSMLPSQTDVYIGTIPAQADGSIVTFSVKAVNSIGYTAVSDEKSYTVAAVVVNYSGLQLNELNGNDKFMELYNKGSNEIPLEGIYIQKDGKTNWTCDERSIAAGAYLLLYSEDVAADHPECPETLIFHSGLSAKKPVRVQLFDPAGQSLDDFNLTTCAKKAPASYSRNNDGTWHFAEATPGAANVQGNDPVSGLE